MWISKYSAIRLKAFWSGLFSSSLANHYNRLCRLKRKEWHHLLLLKVFCVSCSNSRAFYRLELNLQNRVLWKVYDGLANARHFALLRAPMVVTYYIKLFRTGADRHNGILMSLLLLVAEAIIWLLFIYGDKQLFIISISLKRR